MQPRWGALHRAVHSLYHGSSPAPTHSTLTPPQIHFDPSIVSQRDLLHALVAVEHALPDTMRNLAFPGRRITFPVVLDDRWSRAALERYARSVRDEAVYLPSNIEYLTRNNGLEGAEAALRMLVGTDWVRLGRLFLREGADGVLVSWYLALGSTSRVRFWSRYVSYTYEPQPYAEHRAQIDPRCRLIGQKMNPSRTYTPRVRLHTDFTQLLLILPAL